MPRSAELLWAYDAYGRWQDAAAREVEAQARDYDVAHHVTYGGLHLGGVSGRRFPSCTARSVAARPPRPATGATSDAGGQPRCWTASAGPLLKLNRRCQQTIRNSAVTLVNNSATAAACRRLGGTDIRYMLADGLSPEWIADARPQGRRSPGALGGNAPAAQGARTCRPGLCRASPGHAGASCHRRRRAASYAGTRDDRGTLGLTEDVQMLGKLPREEIRSLYDSASVLLFTSLRESFGAPFIEALGRGLQAIALDLAGIADADVGPAAREGRPSGQAR